MNKIERQREFMKTTITIVVSQTDQPTTLVQDKIELAFGEFDRIVKQFTRFNQNSELSNLNRNQGKWTTVTPELFYLVDTMLQLSKATNGAFDPTVIDYLESYGYDPNYNFGKLDNPDLDKMIENLSKTRPTWQQIEVNPKTNQIKLMPNQRLDLGGIGKGYAIDKAHDHLLELENFLIDGGGDLRVKGVNPDGNPWDLGLKHLPEGATEPMIIGHIKSTDIALASSGSWARKVKQFHHLIDPRTGKPSDNLRTVYVTAPNATLADTWATALFIGGRELFEKLPHEMGAMLVNTANQATFNDVLQDIVVI